MRVPLVVLVLCGAASAGGWICEMGGPPRIETPGLVDLARDGKIAPEHLDQIRVLQARLAPRIDAVDLARRGEAPLPAAPSIAQLVEADMTARLRSVCFVLSPTAEVFHMAVKGYEVIEKGPDGQYHLTGRIEPCEMCAAVHAASFRPWSLDTLDASGGELPGARLAKEREVNDALAAWREGLRGILSSDEWQALSSTQEEWLHATITSTVAADPRVATACESCQMRLKCGICGAVEAGVEQAKKAKE